MGVGVVYCGGTDLMCVYIVLTNYFFLFVRANYSTVYGGMIELSNVVRHDKLSTVCRMVSTHA